jgi:hypothetical protein
MLDKQVKPEGWNNWDKVSNESTSYYAEYKNTGVGADTQRESNGHINSQMRKPKNIPRKAFSEIGRLMNNIYCFKIG